MQTVKSFSFQAPKKIIFGMDETKRVGEEALLLNATHALVIVDPVINQIGIAKLVCDYLENAGIKADIFSNVKPEPSIDVLEECASKTKENDFDIVIGVGGGSTLDTTKATAVIAGSNSTVSSLLSGMIENMRSIPKILLPTTAGTGSEVTCGAVFTDYESNSKKGLVNPLLYADVAIIDPKLTISMPPQVTASTGIDVLIHAVESYIARAASPVTEQFALKAIELTNIYLRMAYANGNNIVAREMMALASLNAGFSITNAFCGAAHALAYPLGALYHVPHGVACNVVFPASLKLNSIANLPKFIKMASVVGINTEGIDAKKIAASVIDTFYQLAEDIELPQRLRDIGVSKKDIHKLVELVKQKHLIENNPYRLDEKAITKIYEWSF